MLMTVKNKDQLFLFLVHICGFISLLGVLKFGIQLLLYSAIIYFFTACLGGTIFFHRYLSHRCFQIHRLTFYVLLFCSVWGFYGSPISWAAIHRLHHRTADTSEDPHSPLHEPWWSVMFFSYLKPPNFRLVPDLLSDASLVFVHKYYLRIQLIISVTLIFFGVKYFLALYLWPIVITWTLTSSVNLVCHKWGYTNFLTQDSSKNNLLLGYFVFGEGWHNNHHSHPKKYSFSEKWWELDIGGTIIKFIRRRQA